MQGTGRNITTEFETPEATGRLAARLAPLLQPGDLLLLEGQIGAGKSVFARALIQARLQAAGRLEEVPSPTFTLVQTYDDGLAEIWHADLYRLQGPADIDELGLWEAFDTAICLVEWPDRLGAFAPDNALTLSLAPMQQAGRRRATFRFSNPSWLPKLAQAGVADGP